jgi:hypothetical protein
MQTVPSSNDPKIKQSNRFDWNSYLLNASIAVIGIFLYHAYTTYDHRNSTRSSVIATVDRWSQSQSKGDFNYYIDVTLTNGSKVVAKASPLGPPPPKTGEQIELVKIISTLGFTSYRWERSLMTFTPMPL